MGPPHRLPRQRTRKRGAEIRTKPLGNPLEQGPSRPGPNLPGPRSLWSLRTWMRRMRTSWRKREAAGMMWAKEEATEEDVETEPTLDVEEVGRLEQGAEEEKGERIPISHQ